MSLEIPQLIARNQAIRRQKELFASGGVPDAAVVSDMIAASWFRSRACGLPPGHIFPSPLPEQEFRQALEHGRELLESAAPLMQKLFDAISGSRSVIGLADTSGLILHTVGPEESLKRLAAFTEGYRATEKSSGTNGIGTCLVECRPLEIIGCEHYPEACSA